jgi:hypothetical protein
MVSDSSAALESFYRFGYQVLHSTKSPQDGGIIGHILSNFNLSLLNTSTIQPQPRDLAVSKIRNTLFKSGFFWGLSFGLLWTLVLLLSGCCLLILHCRRKRDTKTVAIYKQVARRVQKKREALDQNCIGRMIQLVLGVIVLLLLFVIILLNGFSLTDVSESLVKTSNNDNNNQFDQVSFIPHIASAVLSIRSFLGNLTQRAQQDTSPIVEEMILYTEKMQKISSDRFQNALQDKIGGTKSKELGEKMTTFLLTMWDSTSKLKGPLDDKYIQEKRKFEIYLHTLQQEFKPLLSSINYNSNKDMYYLINEIMLWQSNPTRPLLSFNFARAFQFAMLMEHRTREKIISDAKYSDNKSKMKMEKTKKRMNELIDVPNMLRNSTAQTWIDMEIKIHPLLTKLDNLHQQIITEGPKKMSNVNVLLILIILFCLIILAICVVTTSIVFIHYYVSQNVFSDSTRNRLKTLTYVLLSLLSLPMLLSMILFISNGILETDLCRFLRVNDIENSLRSGETPILDEKINNFVQKQWVTISNLSPMAPKPNNVLSGIVTRCSNNEPILQAIDAINNLNLKAFNKPEMSKKIVDIGRLLMVESLNETNGLEMLAPGSLDNLKKANNLQHFVDEDLAQMIKNVSDYQEFSFLNDSTTTTNNNNNHEITFNFNDSIIMNKLLLLQNLTGLNQENETLTLLMKSFENLRTIRNDVVDNLNAVHQLPPIGETVKGLQKAVPYLLDQLENKTSLLQIGNELFTQMVELPTPNNSAAMMAIFAPKMMSVIGYCLPIYEAYYHATEAVCTTPNFSLTGLWLFMGSACLLAHLLLLFVLSLLSKKTFHFSECGDDEDDTNINDDYYGEKTFPRLELQEIPNGRDHHHNESGIRVAFSPKKPPHEQEPVL